MKILMIITGMKNGGAERVMSTLCNELSKNNTVRLLVLKNLETDYKISKRVEHRTCNVKNQNPFTSIISINKNIKEFNPDVVLSFMTKTNIVSLLSKIFFKIKIPFIICERANPSNAKFYLKLIRKVVYKEADGCVFQTKQAQDYYTSILKCPNRVLYNPLAPDFNIKPYLGKREKRIVCTARLSIEKNQQFLIQTFSEIHNEFKDYVLEIYGIGPMHKKLQNLINKLKANKYIFLMGRKDNIQNYIKNASLFVLPSNSEGMPNSLIEAMALGIPCIATNCPIGGPEILIDSSKNGILIDMNDKEQLKCAIRKILSDKEFANYLSKNSPKIIEKLDTDRVCLEWYAFISEVVKESNK